MKSLNSATAILMAAAVIAGGVGCKHAPKPVTPIPGYSAAPVSNTDGTTTPVRLQNPTTPVNTAPPVTRPVTDGGRLPGDGVTTGNTLNTPGGGQTTSTQLNPPVVTDQTRINTVGGRMEGVEDPSVLAEDTVYFEYDRNTVKPSEVPKVQRAAAYLKNNPDLSVRIEGNCDERGTEEYNRSLGERRALAIRELLISEGVAPERVTTLSFGEDKPVDSGHDEAAWNKNRRGDFVVIKPQPLQ